MDYIEPEINEELEELISDFNEAVDRALYEEDEEED